MENGHERKPLGLRLWILLLRWRRYPFGCAYRWFGCDAAGTQKKMRTWLAFATSTCHGKAMSKPRFNVNIFGNYTGAPLVPSLEIRYFELWTLHERGWCVASWSTRVKQRASRCFVASMVSLITGIFAPHTNISSLAVRILEVPPLHRSTAPGELGLDMQWCIGDAIGMVQKTLQRVSACFLAGNMISLN